MATHQRRSYLQWQVLMTDFKSSGQSVKAFCNTNQVSPASFYLWRKRLADSSVPSSETSFIDASSLAPNAMNDSSWQISLDLGDGLVLRLSRG